WWAGTTPAGAVALVAQWAPDGEIGSPPETPDQLGFVAQNGNQLVSPPVLLQVPAGTIEPFALLTGRRRDVLVVAGADQAPICFSGDYTVDREGRIARDYTPLLPGSDGVVVRRVSAQDEGVRLALRQGSDTRVALADVGERRDPPVVPVLDRLERRLPGWQKAWSRATEMDLRSWDLDNRDGYHDAFGYHTPGVPRPWRILGALPDGRRLAVQAVVLDGRARLFLMTGEPGTGPAARYLGLGEPPRATELLDPRDGPLLVLHTRLPDRLGVLAAALNATLRYRVRTGAWLPVNGDAALLPDAATAIEVTPRRGRAVTVTVP
ncbi:MAG: hypothetical protein ABW022_20840, partial [Actinoplanes sp.]